MRVDNIRAAAAEARRFLQKVDAFEMQVSAHLRSGSKHYFSAPKEAGALRRASMDLTRALAAMRKPE